MAVESDDLDRAADLTEERTRALIEEVQRKARPEQVRRGDGSWPQEDCEDCGLEIEPGRLELGKIRCFHCQTVLEKRGRR